MKLHAICPNRILRLLQSQKKKKNLSQKRITFSNVGFNLSRNYKVIHRLHLKNLAVRNDIFSRETFPPKKNKHDQKSFVENKISKELIIKIRLLFEKIVSWQSKVWLIIFIKNNLERFRGFKNLTKVTDEIQRKVSQFEVIKFVW